MESKTEYPSEPAEQRPAESDGPEPNFEDSPPAPVLTPLPEIPSTDLGFDLSSIIGGNSGGSTAELAKVHKRASNVAKLAEENEKLKAQLKAMSDRLEAAEQKRQQLSQKEQQR